MLELTKERWKELEHVNAIINRNVNYRTDMELYHKPEFWTIAETQGDCEDYALAKRKKLLELGWPIEAIKLAIVLTPQNEGHAVLTVDTSKGTYVLDNRFGFVMPWKETHYTWISRQNGKSWVSQA